MPPTSAAELSADQVARFARDLAALADPGARVLVAVSGGPDSLALLLLAQAALGDHCHAATVDHGLRPEAADEAAWVADLCAARGIGHAILRATLPDRAGRTANLSARARALRYRLLEDHAGAIGADLIATAHHADDQLETLVMRLNRGAGVAGLAGVRAQGRTARGRVVRPLLGWRRADLAALVAEQGISAIDDPCKVSDRFDRARLRKALAAIDWLDVDRVGVSARALGDAEDAIAWTARRLENDLCRNDADGATLRIDDVPFELRRRLVERCVARLDPHADLRGGAIADAVRMLDSQRATMLGNIRCESRGAEWRFSPAPPRRTP